MRDFRVLVVDLVFLLVRSGSIFAELGTKSERSLPEEPTALSPIEDPLYVWP